MRTERLVHLLPRNGVSYLTGVAARFNWPPLCRPWVMKAFVRLFHIDAEEMRGRLEACRSFEDVFTRRLKKKLRPISGPLCVPCDGYLMQSERTDGLVIPAKGVDYSSKDLIFGDFPGDSSFCPWWVSTIYLAPHNYHRVHIPATGTLVAVRYLPGDLWPVNPRFVSRIPKLFCRNERLSFEFRFAEGGRGYLIMVGALNVGRMKSSFVPEWVTNSASRQFKGRARTIQVDSLVKRGAELGVFMLGSTVVMLFDRQATETLGKGEVMIPGKEVRLGQRMSCGE